MKRNGIRSIALLLFVCLLSLLFAGCAEGGEYDFLRAKQGGKWGGDEYVAYDDYDDEDDDDDYNGYNGGQSSSGNGGQSSSGNGGQSGSGNGGQSSSGNGGTEYTEDYKFEHSTYDMAPGEMSVCLPYTCEDVNVVVPPTYEDYTGTVYRIVKDFKTGFGGIPAETIKLPEGFREIEVGFSGCPNLKTIYLPSTMTKIDGYTVTNCPRLKTIEFNGTKAQWNAIEKDDHWNYLAPALGIRCTDGFIELQSWAESHP